MLRLIVLALLLLNAGYYAWSHGMLRTYGFAPAQQAEPQRVAQQIQPQLLRVLTGDEARKADAMSGERLEACAGEGRGGRDDGQ